MPGQTFYLTGYMKVQVVIFLTPARTHLPNYMVHSTRKLQLKLSKFSIVL